LEIKIPKEGIKVPYGLLDLSMTQLLQGLKKFQQSLIIENKKHLFLEHSLNSLEKSDIGHTYIIIMDSHGHIHHRHHHNHHIHHYHHHILRTNKMKNKNKMIRSFVGNKFWDMSIHSTCKHDIPSTLVLILEVSNI